VIEVKNLFFKYNKSHEYAVNGISFDINEGEIFGFLGPNGAGKSTTQKILTGILPVQEGEIYLRKERIEKFNNDYFNAIGVSFEQPNIYGKLTGKENLDFFASMYDYPVQSSSNLLKMVDLDSAANKKAGEYSKGMQQRLVFARSLINRPKILFLDEPVSGLDPSNAVLIKEIIKGLRKQNTTIFLTTHNMTVADELCDRVAFINSGKIVLIDSPRNLKLRYGRKLVKIEYENDGCLNKEILSLVDDKDKQRIVEITKTKLIETIHSQEATLEDIFIKVTGRELG